MCEIGLNAQLVMATEEGDGTNPDRDGPGDGRSSRDQSDSSSGIYAPPRRSTNQGPRARSDDRPKSPGFFSRLTGRHRIDEIREERLKPYQYDSNAQALRWTAVTMAIWCVLVAALAFTDWRNGQLYSEWVSTGIDTIPPSSGLESQVEPARLAAWRDGGDAMRCAFIGGRLTTSLCPEGELPAAEVDAFITEQDYLCFQRSEDGGFCDAVWTSRGVVEFARLEGFDCPDGRTVFNTVAGEGQGSVGCDRVFKFGEEFESSQDRSQLLWLFVVLAGLVVAFPYLSVIHRASRNLLTLKSRGQKHRPEWAVLHHFIPFFNFVMPGLVLRELFRGSDPRVGHEDDEEWKSAGRANPVMFAWHALWIVALIMNPILIPRIFGATNLTELTRTNDLLLLGDVVLLALGAVGVWMLYQLHMWQENRHAQIGLITVTPPQPIDLINSAADKRKRENNQNGDSGDRD